MIKNVKNVWKERKIKLNCEFVGFKNGRLNYNCKECKKSYTKLVNESIKNFRTLHKFYNNDLNKFFLLLRKGIYQHEHEHVKKVWEAFKKKILVSIMIYKFNVIHFCLLMYLKTLEISALKYMGLILPIFCLHQD